MKRLHVGAFASLTLLLLIGCGGGGGSSSTSGGTTGVSDTGGSSTGSTPTTTGGSTGTSSAIDTYKGSYAGTYTSEYFDNALIDPDMGAGPSGTATATVASTGYTLIKIKPTTLNAFDAPAAGTLGSDGTLTVSYVDPVDGKLVKSPATLSLSGGILTLKYTYFKHSTMSDGLYLTLTLTKS